MPAILLTALGNQWIRLALCIFISFCAGSVGGYVKGWNASNADHWIAQAIELERASKQKDVIIAADADRAATDAEELAKRDKFIEDMLHATPASACRLDQSDIERLRSIAAGNGDNRASLSTGSKRPKGRGK